MASKRAIRRRGEQRSRHVFLNWKPSLTRTCKSKQDFKTYEDAEMAMEKLMAASYYDGEPLNVYRCPINPSHFHYGHIIGLRRSHGQAREGHRRH